MAFATPPDLARAVHPIQPLALSYVKGVEIEPHVHEWGQLLYAESGVMLVDTPSSALLVPPHRAVWIPPHVHHGVSVVSDLEMRNIYLHTELAKQIGSELAVVEVTLLLRELIRRRVSLTPCESEAYREALDGFLVVELRRSSSALLQAPMPANGDRRLRSLCNEVLRAPSLDISFEQHADVIGASTRTLARLFKTELGLTFSEWRRTVQLAYAAARLLEAVPVKSVAAELGYNLSSFSEMFKRATAVTPSVYAATHLQR
ncbi:helix-turn-helix transcriptional regulator [Pseudomonas sp. MAFF 301449]|uniref:Helix-turn-helix transcriptional regulator n=1 Tax=Pseudomonas cyclaminis TaxID=2781239 RepID=A0ABR9SN59_9PSED|nr:helix-turn-helix transcriptional regulator [Pseudomonas cyclaminis]MBE8590360.1 helix-turn-helix transcriptional regulator [Pseudomonas cyclaminis]MBE8602347.1 helix-turn-helix transcriptional regulator [Pseudomonas cyclaminis]